MLAAAGASARVAARATAQQQARTVLRRWLSGFGKGQPVAMPALSPTMVAGKLVKWNVKEGDKLRAGLSLASIETDKVRSRC